MKTWVKATVFLVLIGAIGPLAIMAVKPRPVTHELTPQEIQAQRDREAKQIEELK